MRVLDYKKWGKGEKLSKSGFEIHNKYKKEIDRICG